MDNDFKYKYLKYKKKFLDLEKYYKTKLDKLDKKYSFFIFIDNNTEFREFDNYQDYLKAFIDEQNKGNIDKGLNPLEE
jgi:hypothetical protein